MKTVEEIIRAYKKRLTSSPKPNQTNKAVNNKQRQHKTNRFNSYRELSRVERWKNSEEGKHMAKHCPRLYYETLQEMRL